MSKVTTSTVAAGFVALQLLASSASAACLEGGDLANPTLTCTLTDSGNISDSRDNLIITVESDAELVRANGRPVQVDGDNQTIINMGLIESGNDAAIRGRGENLTVDNSGIIRSGDRAIRLQNNANGFTLINRENGQIISVNQAVRLDNDDNLEDATIINYGLIDSSAGRAIQSRGPGGRVFNYGTLRGGEEVVEAREDFYLENYGLIALHGLEWDASTRSWTRDDAVASPDEDGVQFASGELHNYGVIMGMDDGIDIDEGLIHNHVTGVIISAGPDNEPSHGGIDVDPLFEPNTGSSRAAGPLTIINEGYIEGPRAITTDIASTSEITVDNSGSLVGRSGVAIGFAPGQGDSRLIQRVGGSIWGDVIFGSGNDVLEMRGGQIVGNVDMSAGDDTLEIYAGRVTGVIDLGSGTNTLRVFSTEVGTYTFANTPEIVDMSNAPDFALFSGVTLVVADPRVFAVMDDVSTRLSYELADTVLRSELANGWWISGQGRIAENDQSQGVLAGGRDFGNIGVYLVHMRGRDDSLYKLDQKSTAAGLRSGWSWSDQTRASATLFAGVNEVTLDSPVWAMGKGDVDGYFAGLSARIDHSYPVTSAMQPGLLSLQLGVTRYRYDAFTVDSLGSARFASRDVTTAFVSTEAATPVTFNNGMLLRPFVGVHALFTDAEKVTMSLPGNRTNFATDGDKRLAGLRLGTELSLSNMPWRARLEAQFDENGHSAFALGGSVSF